MFASSKRGHATTADPSALDALLDAEGAVAVRMREAEHQAAAIVEQARADAARADEGAARALAAELEALRARGGRDRSDDELTIGEQAERRRRRFADADAGRITAIAARLAAAVAPPPEGAP